MATYSSVLAWRIPGTAEPGELPSMGSHRVGHDWSDLAAAAAHMHASKTRSTDINTYHIFSKWQVLDLLFIAYEEMFYFLFWKTEAR